jgi:(p)ppGpp synthase/HD superfamily hydrolase
VRQAISGAPAIDEAEPFVEEAYRSRSGASAAAVEHPRAVAELLREDGQPPTLVLAGLLHDILEDTDVTAGELCERFGKEVTRLVEALTEDPSIKGYVERKAALRRQILGAGAGAATVALADKTAKIAALSSPPKETKLEHYRATIDGIEERYGRSALSERARAELERLSSR